MPASVAQRLTTLEKQFAALQSRVLEIQPRSKDWRRTAGTFPRDRMTLQAEKFGREWRSKAR